MNPLHISLFSQIPKRFDATFWVFFPTFLQLFFTKLFRRTYVLGHQEHRGGWEGVEALHLHGGSGARSRIWGLASRSACMCAACLVLKMPAARRVLSTNTLSKNLSLSPRSDEGRRTTMGEYEAVGPGDQLRIKDPVPGLQDLGDDSAGPTSGSFRTKRPQLGVSTGDDVGDDGALLNDSHISLAKLVPPSSSEKRGEAVRGGLARKASLLTSPQSPAIRGTVAVGSPPDSFSSPEEFPGKRALRRRSTLTPYTQKKGENSVVSVDSVRADLASRGHWLKPEDLHYDYTPGGEIGKGAMGMIYKAEYVTSHGRRTVAVKHMHKGGDFSESELLEAALHEMIMGYKIKTHENIVEFVGAAQHSAFGLVLVYELIDGINLEDFFHAQKSKKASWKPKFKYSLKWGEQAPKKKPEKSAR
jgi:hypothetical protein